MTDTNGPDQTRFVKSPASAPSEGHDPEADGGEAGPFDQTYVAKAPPAPAKLSLDEVDFDVTSGFDEGSAAESADVFDITKGADDEPFDVAPGLAADEVEPTVVTAALPDPAPAPQGSSGTLYLVVAVIVIAAGVAAWLLLA